MGNFFGGDGGITNTQPRRRRYGKPLERLPLEFDLAKRSLYSDCFSFEIFDDLSGVESIENYGILPVGTLLNIFSFLDLPTILQSSCSCKLFHRIIDSQIFWRLYFSNISYAIEETKEEDKVKTNWKKKVFDELASFRGRTKFYDKTFFSSESSSIDIANDEKYLIFKFLFIGDSGVGKSSLLLRFMDNIFHDRHISTIGVDFKIRRMMYRNMKMKLQVWDIAGEERFRTITRSYYRGVMGIFLCYSIDNRTSFENCEHWIQEIRSCAMDDVQIVLIGMKCDLGKQRTVSREMVSDFLSKNGMSIEHDWCECSSKGKLYTSLPYGILIEKVLRTYSKGGFCEVYGTVLGKDE